MCRSAYSAGLHFTYVPIANRAAIAQAKPRLDLFEDAFGPGMPVYAYTRETEGPSMTSMPACSRPVSA